jgi:hypothetical protein
MAIITSVKAELPKGRPTMCTDAILPSTDNHIDILNDETRMVN